MEKLFIHARSDIDIKLPEEHIKNLKGKIGLITTIQHLHKIGEVTEQLDSVVGGQVLGCDASKAVSIKDDVDSFLYIGTGQFHPIEVALKTGKTVQTYNPETKELSEVDQQQIEKILKRRKGAYLAYLNSENVGVLISTKPGQFNPDYGLSDGKSYYYFVGDMITPGELENFPFIDCWVNTACPRIAEDSFSKPVINLVDLQALIQDP